MTLYSLDVIYSSNFVSILRANKEQTDSVHLPYKCAYSGGKIFDLFFLEDAVILTSTRKSSSHFTFLFEFSKAKPTLTTLRGKPSTPIRGPSDTCWQTTLGIQGSGLGEESWQGGLELLAVV